MITVEIYLTVWLALSFAYSPTYIAICKDLGGRFGGGRWIIHRDKFQALVGRVGASMIVCGPELQKLMPADPFVDTKPTYVLPDFKPRKSTWTQQNTPYGLGPTDFQATGSTRLIQQQRVLMLDPMGVGKSKMLLDAANYVHDHGTRPLALLGVCPASAVTNWGNEAEKFSGPCSITLLRGNRAQRRQLLRSAKRSLSLLFASYQMMVSDIDDLAQIPWDWIVLDEAHYVKSNPLNGPQSLRAAAIHYLDAPRKTAMTGTLSPNSLDDTWNILRWLGVEKRGWAQYERETLKTITYTRGYAELKKVVDYTPSGLATAKSMIGPIMIRRTKDEVLPSLPPFTHTDIEVTLSAEETRAYKAAEKDFLLYLKDHEIQHIDQSAMTIRLRQIACGVFVGDKAAKMETAASISNDIAANGGKWIVACTFVDPIKVLEHKLFQYGPAIIHGGLSTAQRDANIARFQTDPDCRVIIVSVSACREAINLTAASAIIHIDKEWSPAYVSQFEARAQRIGSERHQCINVYSLMARLQNGDKTIDYGIEALLEKKGRVAAQLVGA